MLIWQTKLSTIKSNVCGCLPPEAMLCLKTSWFIGTQTSFVAKRQLSHLEFCGSTDVRLEVFKLVFKLYLSDSKVLRPNVSSTKSLVIRRLNANMVQKSYNAYIEYIEVDWNGGCVILVQNHRDFSRQIDGCHQVVFSFWSVPSSQRQCITIQARFGRHWELKIQELGVEIQELGATRTR